MDYTQVEFNGITRDQSEMLIAWLAALDYVGFEEDDDVLRAYIPSLSFDEAELRQFAGRLNLSYGLKQLPSVNWNSAWESNFSPVVVDDFCAIRADFHQPITHVLHEIVITPKMSFGTGHHATTFMMVEMMKNIDLTGHRVLDFGTGTGVLAILAAKMGAAAVTAIDNDEWSIVNARENFERNLTSDIELLQADAASVLTGPFGVILANITRNVILDNLDSFLHVLEPGGILVLSGLLADDEDVLLLATNQRRLLLNQKMQRGNWLCLFMEKNSR